MDKLVIGGIALSIVISIAVYYFLNKKLKREIENIKNSLELGNKKKVMRDSFQIPVSLWWFFAELERFEAKPFRKKKMKSYTCL